ncbi:MAG: hypothetical protein MRY74_07355 [Neomegalonema sp.]|nr:hypothetical protein [Neomegalonema sp.]
MHIILPLLVLALFGGVIGYVAWSALNLRIEGRTAIAAGMFGAMFGGFGARLGMGPFAAILAAIAGAALVILFAKMTRKQ